MTGRLFSDPWMPRQFNDQYDAYDAYHEYGTFASLDYDLQDYNPRMMASSSSTMYLLAVTLPPVLICLFVVGLCVCFRHKICKKKRQNNTGFNKEELTRMNTD